MSEEYNDPKGGEEGYGGDGPNLRYDEFVGRIVQDPNEPPSVTLLSGYLGSASEEGHVRVYLDEELCRYVEIPEKAIRHTQELSPEQSPLGGSLVWIDRDAEVVHGAAGSERRKATFLEGRIAEDYMGGGSDYLSGGITTQTRECVGPPPTSVGPSCGPSRLRPCIPQTEIPGCRTRTGIYCTRLGPGCGLTSFDPVCTIAGQHCHTALPHQCQSVYSPCVTQNQSYCAASGYVPCNPPIDFTIYEQPGVQQQFGPQVPFAGGGFGAAQGFAPFMPPPSAPIICPDSRFIAACHTLTNPACNVHTTAVNCPTQNCPTRFVVACQVSRIAICPDTRNAACQVLTAFGCPTRYNCPTLPNGCPGYTRFGACETYGPCPSAVDACPTRLGCYETAGCGASIACNPGGGGGGFDPGGF
jgi:hypothetical protein